MAVNTLLVKSYMTNVYRTGRNSLTNIAILRPEYVEPVMQYSAQTLYIEEVDWSLSVAYITADEHAATLALKAPEDPQHQPPLEFSMMEETGTTL